MEQFIKIKLREALSNKDTSICDHLTAKNYKEIYNWLSTADIPQIDDAFIDKILKQLKHSLKPDYNMNTTTSSIGTNSTFPDDLDTSLSELQSILCK